LREWVVSGVSGTALVLLLGGCAVGYSVVSDEPECASPPEQQRRSAGRLVSKAFLPPSSDAVAWTINRPEVADRIPVAQARNALSARPTEYLLAFDFGFQLPEPSLIKGVSVAIERYRSPFGEVQDRDVRLAVDGRPVGADLAGNKRWPEAPKAAVYDADLESRDKQLSASTVNQKHFGIAISALLHPLDRPQEAFVSSIEMTVDWCRPAEPVSDVEATRAVENVQPGSPSDL
jgi:hypothetical protein